MKRGDRERLDDIAEAINTIKAHAADRSSERIRRDALLYNLLKPHHASDEALIHHHIRSAHRWQ